MWHFSADILNWSSGNEGKGNVYENGDIETWSVDELGNPHHQEKADDYGDRPVFLFYISSDGGISDGGIGYSNTSSQTDSDLEDEICDRADLTVADDIDASVAESPRSEDAEGYGHAWNLVASQPDGVDRLITWLATFPAKLATPYDWSEDFVSEAILDRFNNADPERDAPQIVAALERAGLSPDEAVDEQKNWADDQEPYTHYNYTTGKPCSCGWGRRDLDTTRTAGYEDLAKMKRYKSPESQAVLSHLQRDGYINERTEKWIPWLMNEIKNLNISWKPERQIGGRMQPRGYLAYNRLRGALGGGAGEWHDPRDHDYELSQTHWQHWCDWLNGGSASRREFNPTNDGLDKLLPGIRAWDEKMAEDARRANKDKHRETGEILHTTTENPETGVPAGWTVRKLNGDEVKAEGDAMGHCIGSYKQDVDSGRLTALSLRDPKGDPHVTTGIMDDGWDSQGLNRPEHEGGYIYDHKGKNNQDPKSEYNAMLRQYFETIPLEERPSSNDEESIDDHDDVRSALRKAGEVDELGLPNRSDNYINWQNLLQTATGDRFDRYQNYDNDTGSDLYQLAKQKDQIPEFGEAFDIERQKAEEERDNWMIDLEPPTFDNGVGFHYKTMPNPDFWEEGNRDYHPEIAQSYNRTADEYHRNHGRNLEEILENEDGNVEIKNENNPHPEQIEAIPKEWYNWYARKYEAAQNEIYDYHLQEDPKWHRDDHIGELLRPHQVQNESTNEWEYSDDVPDKPFEFPARNAMAADPHWLDHWIKRNGPYVYHRTNAPAVDSLLQNGILPWDHPDNPTEQTNEPGTRDDPRPNHVYLHSPEHGGYKDQYEDYYTDADDPNRPRRVRVDLRKLDPNNLVADEDSVLYEQNHPAYTQFSDDIDEDNDKEDWEDVLTQGDWADQNPHHFDNVTDTAKSLENNQTIAHNGVIPPEAISEMPLTPQEKASAWDKPSDKLSPREASYVAASDIITRTVYRSGAEPMPPPVDTVQEVIDYERNVLERTDVKPYPGVDPTKVSAAGVYWVTFTPEHSQEYEPEEESDEDWYKHDLMRSWEETFRIVATDGCNGYLIKPVSYAELDQPSSQKQAAETRNQLVQRAQDLPEDKSHILHQFDDGWSIRQPSTFGDHYREGELMSNCLSPNNAEPDELWDFYHYGDNPAYDLNGDPMPRFKDEAMSHPAPSETYSLRDPDNIPRMTVLNEYPLGRHNSTPKQEYVDRWNQYEQAGARQTTPMGLHGRLYK